MGNIIEGNVTGTGIKKLLQRFAEGGDSQQRFAAEGVVAAGYLSMDSSLSPGFQQLTAEAMDAVLELMASPDLGDRQTGMELAWFMYVGRRAARHGQFLKDSDFGD